MNTPVLEFDKVSKSFKEFVALDKINLVIESKQFASLVGPNGAGKSTFIKLLLGCLKPTKGSIYLFGEKITEKNLKRIGYSPERLEFPNTTVRTFLRYIGFLKGLTLSKINSRTIELTKEFEISNKLNWPINNLSAGMKQKLRIIQSILNIPDLLVLDEPTSNLDIFTREFLLEKIRTLCKENSTSVIFSTHILSDLDINWQNHHVILLKQGNLLYSGSSNDVKVIKNEFSHYEIETNNLVKTLQILKEYKEYIDLLDIQEYTSNKIPIVIRKSSSNNENTVKDIVKRIIDCDDINLLSFRSCNNLKSAILKRMSDL